MTYYHSYMKLLAILGFCLTQIAFSPSAAISSQVDLSSNSIQSVSSENDTLIENIILTWKKNPATSQAVTWRTSSSLPQSFAEIASAKASPEFTKTARKYPATTTKIKVDKHSVYYHSVNFEDLTPDTMYAYRVGSDPDTSHAQRAAEPEFLSILGGITVLENTMRLHSDQ